MDTSLSDTSNNLHKDNKVVLSFDVGIYNLAYCLMHVDGTSKITIQDWDVLNIGGSKEKKLDISALGDNLVSILHDKFFDIDIDYVLIENQPVQKNPTMKSIQMIIFTFFKMKSFQVSHVDVRLVSASNKLKVKHKTSDSYPDKTKYQQNKLLSIAYARNYLENVFPDASRLSLMNTHKKKDDLCDSYLQGVHFIEANSKLFVR